MMERLIWPVRWRRFWFASDTAFNLAMMRIIVAAHSLWILQSRDFAAISDLTEFWVRVPETLKWRFLVWEGHAGIEQVLQRTAAVALLAAVLGVYPRVACSVAGILIYHLAPLETVIWTGTAYTRGLTLAPILLIALALAPSGDALRVGSARPATTPPSWCYGWPRRLAWLLLAQMYLFSAWGKLLDTGLAWSTAENMRAWILFLNVDEYATVFQAAGRWVADRPIVLWSVGVGAVVFEWCFIIALVSQGARRLLVPLAVLFHLGIVVTLSIHVGEAWLLVLFIDWEAARTWIRNRWRAPPPDQSFSTAAAS